MCQIISFQCTLVFWEFLKVFHICRKGRWSVVVGSLKKNRHVHTMQFSHIRYMSDLLGVGNLESCENRKKTFLYSQWQ
jgi:hypothetical protein